MCEGTTLILEQICCLEVFSIDIQRIECHIACPDFVDCRQQRNIHTVTTMINKLLLNIKGGLDEILLHLC
ncbi:hypothetical protein P3L10_023398 [Capsicum annuum]